MRTCIAYMHANMHAYTHACMHASTHTFHACMHACIHTYLHTYTHTRTHSCNTYICKYSRKNVDQLYYRGKGFGLDFCIAPDFKLAQCQIAFHMLGHLGLVNGLEGRSNHQLCVNLVGKAVCQPCSIKQKNMQFMHWAAPNGKSEVPVGNLQGAILRIGSISHAVFTQLLRAMPMRVANLWGEN